MVRFGSLVQSGLARFVGSVCSLVPFGSSVWYVGSVHWFSLFFGSVWFLC